MGIGNTTSSAALTSLLTGIGPDEVTGKGTGIGGQTRARKLSAIRRALERCRPLGLDALGKMSEVGGYEIAALTGAILQAASQRIAVVLDGFITGVAALAAVEMAPAARDYLIASHRSPEPGHRLILDRLQLEPLLDCRMRLGEASGAVLAFPLLESACALLSEVRTFREAGIEELLDEKGLK